MKIGLMVNADDRSQERTTVIVLENQDELGTLVSALSLYSRFYADDPDDDSPEGHTATRMLCSIIDQAGDGVEVGEKYVPERDDLAMDEWRHRLGRPAI